MAAAALQPRGSRYRRQRFSLHATDLMHRRSYKCDSTLVLQDCLSVAGTSYTGRIVDRNTGKEKSPPPELLALSR